MAGETYSTTNLLEALSLWLSDCSVILVNPLYGKNKLQFSFEKNWKLERSIGYFQKKQLKFDPERWLKGMREFSKTYKIAWDRWQ